MHRGLTSLMALGVALPGCLAFDSAYTRYCSMVGCADAGQAIDGGSVEPADDGGIQPVDAGFLQYGCDTAPPRTCEGVRLRAYRQHGPGADQQCLYAPTFIACANGCSNGACTGDSCAGVFCDQPPASSCLNATTVQVFESGTCDGGVCQFVRRQQTCPSAHSCIGGRCQSFVELCNGSTCMSGCCSGGICIQQSSQNQSKCGVSGNLCGNCGAGFQCATGRCEAIDAGGPLDAGPSRWSPDAYVKASNTKSYHRFGTAIAVALDGNTFAVGAPGEGSDATGINGNQSDDSNSRSGAVYVFRKSSGSWMQEAYIKASNSEAGDDFGSSLSLSGDGNTLVVGASEEESNATGINGNQSDNSLSNAGAVYVFRRTGSVWVQEAYVKASNTGDGDLFGHSVSISSDGSVFAVGAMNEASAARGINGNQADNSSQYSGAVYVFRRSGATWTQEAYMKASNASRAGDFGCAVSLSSDGNALAVGAWGESSAARGINGDQTSDVEPSSGAVYVFRRSGAAWTQEAYVKASNTQSGDKFGFSVALSPDARTLAVGALGECGNASGVNGNQNNNSFTQAGAAFVFKYTGVGSMWEQEAYVKASRPDPQDLFGSSVALSASGNVLAVGAPGESSSATGLNGNASDNSATSSGAVNLFVRLGAGWVQQTYVKASNTGNGDAFGTSVSLDGDARWCAVGAPLEASNSRGLNGNQGSDQAPNSGAGYLYSQ